MAYRTVVYAVTELAPIDPADLRAAAMLAFEMDTGIPPLAVGLSAERITVIGDARV